MSPIRTLSSCGSSSSDQRRSHRPVLVILGSSRILNSRPLASLSPAYSDLRCVQRRAAHRAELVHGEALAVLADPGLPEEDRPAIGALDGQRRSRRKAARAARTAAGRRRPVEHALDDLLAAAQVRMIDIEQLTDTRVCYRLKHIEKHWFIGYRHQLLGRSVGNRTEPAARTPGQYQSLHAAEDIGSVSTIVPEREINRLIKFAPVPCVAAGLDRALR